MKIPPFRAIVAFHATAASGSMVKAAEIIGVTPSAISQQVQIIEAHIGIRLFSRIGRRVVLTEAGERYFELIRDDIDRITAVTGMMSDNSSYSVLNLRIAPTFATKWILPRLHEFTNAHPDIELRLDATNDPPDFERENIDIEIRHGAGIWPGVYVEPIGEEQMQVLCSPNYAAPGSLRVQDLPDHQLIHSVKNIVQWPQWFAAQGFIPERRLKRILFDRAHMSIDMAVYGHGIILESTLIAADEIALGRLVSPIKNPIAVSQSSLWIVCPHSHLSRRKVRSFLTWLRDTLPMGRVY